MLPLDQIDNVLKSLEVFLCQGATRCIRLKTCEEYLCQEGNCLLLRYLNNLHKNFIHIYQLMRDGKKMGSREKATINILYITVIERARCK